MRNSVQRLKSKLLRRPKPNAKMNTKILHKVRPQLFSKESLAKTYFKSKHSLVGIAADERYDIQKAMLENWGSRSGFVEEMSEKFDRSDAQWEALFDNEMHNADQAGEMLVEARKGKTTKSWTLGESKSGPCDECVALSGSQPGCADWRGVFKWREDMLSSSWLLLFSRIFR